MFLSALHIIPLKMRAHIDNGRLRNKGVDISEKTLRKHRADIIRLADLLPANARLVLDGELRTDAKTFFVDFEAYAFRETNRKKRVVLEEALEFLRGT